MPFGVDERYLAEAFKKAGDYVIEHLKTGQVFGNPDNMFMPIAYLYRHSLELMLKHLVRLGIAARLIEESSDINCDLGKHNLYRLWSHACTAIENRWPNGDKKIISNTKALIDDFQRIDKSGQNLRYARDSQDRPTARKFPDSIELVEFRSAYEGVFNLLSGCSAEFDFIVEYITEMRNEAKGYQ